MRATNRTCVHGTPLTQACGDCEARTFEVANDRQARISREIDVGLWTERVEQR